MDELTLAELDALYKFLALKLSDRVSAQLKVNFDMKDVSCSQGVYSELIKQTPSFCYAALMNYSSRGVLLFIDPKLIYILSNRMLGGKGIIETKKEPYFTLSEKSFGEQFVKWFIDFHKEHHIPLAFVRSEENASHVHYFYPDETVMGVVIKCKIHDKVAGNIIAIHPIMDSNQ